MSNKQGAVEDPISPAELGGQPLALRVVAAREKALAKQRQPLAQRGTSIVLVQRCAVCQGVGIVYRPGINPASVEFGEEDWDALYREAGKGWYRPEIFCQECMRVGLRTALRIAFNSETGKFRVMARACASSRSSISRRAVSCGI
jgi:hypothetical protein